MKLTSAGYVSIAELVVYFPALFAAAVVTSRHGFNRSSGWIYTLILCLVRIIGACCQLASYNDQSSGLIEATLIMDSIGISPLLLATLGVLSRFADFVNAKGHQVFGMTQFRVIQLLITVGLILSIIGGTSSTNSDGKVTVQGTSKVGIILYFVGFAGLTWLLIRAMGYRSAVPTQESRSPIAVALAWPLILTRLAYSVAAVFIHDHLFSVVGGSVAIRVGMAVVEEFLVVLDYIMLGFTLQQLLPEQRGEIANRPWKARR